MIFTIAIPTYNNADSIENTIKSCINQDFENDYEIIVVNNHCTDNTSQILEKYKNEIIVYENRTTVTMWENHNVCLQKSKGDFVIFCHSDDQLLPDALTKYFDTLKRRNFPKRYVLWGRSMFRDFYSHWNEAGFSLNQLASGHSAIFPFAGNGLTPSGTCYSRKSFVAFEEFIVSNHKLSPSDMVTMWKLVINQFEFEMSDKIFFIRKQAGTAVGQHFKYSNIVESIVDSINALKKKLKAEEFQQVIELLKLTKTISPMLASILIVYKFTKKKHFIKILLIQLIRRPWMIRHKVIRNAIFN